MSRNEDTEDGYVNERNNQSRSPFKIPNRLSVLRNDRDSVDDDLHQKLDFKNPTKKDEE